jgi:Family of unknown function (DUF5681)
MENRYWGGVDEGGNRGRIAQLNRRALMSHQKSLKPADYAGGCHQPPKASQFMPGKSGNPKGSPKDRLPAEAVVQDVIRQKIAVKAIPAICATDLSDELARAFVLADNKVPEAAP